MTLDLRPRRPQTLLPAGELGVGEPGRGLPVIAVAEGIGVFQRHPVTGAPEHPHRLPFGGPAGPGDGDGAGSPARSSRRSSVQHASSTRMMTALLITLTVAVSIRLAARTGPAAAVPRSRPRASRPRVGQMNRTVQHGHRDRGSHPGPRRGRRRDPGQMPQVAVSRSAESRRLVLRSPRPGRGRGLSCSRQRSAQARTYGWLSTVFSVAGCSWSSAASRDQAPRSVGLGLRAGRPERPPRPGRPRSAARGPGCARPR